MNVNVDVAKFLDEQDRLNRNGDMGQNWKIGYLAGFTRGFIIFVGNYMSLKAESCFSFAKCFFQKRNFFRVL